MTFPPSRSLTQHLHGLPILSHSDSPPTSTVYSEPPPRWPEVATRPTGANVRHPTQAMGSESRIPQEDTPATAGEDLILTSGGQISAATAGENITTTSGGHINAATEPGQTCPSPSGQLTGSAPIQPSATPVKPPASSLEPAATPLGSPDDVYPPRSPVGAGVDTQEFIPNDPCNGVDATKGHSSDRRFERGNVFRKPGGY